MELLCKKCGVLGVPNISDKTMHLTAYCGSCGSYIMHLPQNDRDDFVFYFGKYKERKLSEMKSKDELSWLSWSLKNVKFKDWQKELITNHIKRFA